MHSRMMRALKFPGKKLSCPRRQKRINRYNRPYFFSLLLIYIENIKKRANSPDTCFRQSEFFLDHKKCRSLEKKFNMSFRWRARVLHFASIFEFTVIFVDSQRNGPWIDFLVDMSNNLDEN